nr:MAG TPA: hypothetical protein [Caudoviricetes sp.]DAY66977.1 MAG TPA: hypothetical protein [Caudoviricetes sp.]
MVSDEALKKLQEQIAAWPMAQRFVVQQLIRDYLRNREDLRAYKATGLTPEDITAAVSIPMFVKVASAALGATPERLRELAEADKEGRTVTAPYCKNCEYGEAYDRMDGKKGIYCHCPRSILRYGNGSIFTPVRENLDFCSYGKPREG